LKYGVSFGAWVSEVRNLVIVNTKFIRFLKSKWPFMRGFRLGFASLPLFFGNFSQTPSLIVQEDGIASDWQRVGSDLRNAIKEELKR
jgi:hypothetical protein